jgi:hypothetical protein
MRTQLDIHQAAVFGILRDENRMVDFDELRAELPDVDVDLAVRLLVDDDVARRLGERVSLTRAARRALELAD